MPSRRRATRVAAAAPKSRIIGGAGTWVPPVEPDEPPPEDELELLLELDELLEDEELELLDDEPLDEPDEPKLDEPEEPEEPKLDEPPVEVELVEVELPLLEEPWLDEP